MKNIMKDVWIINNYRPVSFTSLTIKVFERCIKNELLAACKGNIDSRKHGFVNAKSCTTQLVPFTFDLEITINNKLKTYVFFDFAI